MDNIEQITIVGTGLLGASCGLGLKAAGYKGKIAGVGRRIETAQRALELGCADSVGIDVATAVRDSQLVIIAIPVGGYEQLLNQLACVDHPGLTITDVGSTKQQVGLLARRLLPAPARFVGSHPMAGSEQHGPDAASASLFKGKLCVITAQPDTDRDALDRVEKLWTALGMRLVHLSAIEHDRQVARISHLPHAVAVLLLELVAKEGGLDLASTGFKDLTRLASGNPQIWSDIFSTNRAAMIEALDAFGTELSQFRSLVELAKDNELADLLKQNKQVRDAWIDSLKH